MLVVVLVVVLLFSVVPNRCCCHHRRCYRQTPDAQWPSPLPRPPPSPLPSQSHSLQLIPPPSPCCRFHCPREHSGYCPLRRNNDANSVNAAIACYRHYRWSSPWPPPLSLPSLLHLLQQLLLPSPSPSLSPSPQPPLTSPPALIWHCLTLGLAVTTARQGATP